MGGSVHLHHASHSQHLSVRSREAPRALQGPHPPTRGGTFEELLGARALLGAPDLTTRSKKLLGTNGIATRSVFGDMGHVVT